MAARYLINLVERLNQLFSSVDWGWDINGDRLTNIGFLINAIKIHNHTTSNKPDHFNSNTSKEEGVFSYEEVLRTFSIEEGTKDSCLTLLISAKIFSANVLGISNIGHNGEKGICAIKGLDKQFTNTAIATVKRRSGLMITREVDLVVAHEIGHSLGSYHDEDEATNDPDGSEDCLPKNSQGRYVMHGSPNSGYEKNNYNFSPCSIRSIQRTLYELASKCFVEEKIAFCGNGILEKGEECDVGSEINAASDRCCTSECTLRQVSHCSPYNFECCTDDCQVASVDQICQARNSDLCRNASFCNGVSKTCPEPTILKDGSECDDEGKCINGECKSACHLHSPELLPCLCERENETCHRCCRSKTDGQCKPIGLGKLLPEDSICIYGQCHNNICEKKLTDSTAFFLRIIGDIGSPNSPRIFNDYFIFIIVTITLLIWLPCGAIIVYKDGNNEGAIREERENIEYIHVNKGPTTLPEANAE